MKKAARGGQRPTPGRKRVGAPSVTPGMPVLPADRRPFLPTPSGRKDFQAGDKNVQGHKLGSHFSLFDNTYSKFAVIYL